VADAGTAGEFTQRKLKAPGLTQDFQRSPDDGNFVAAQVVNVYIGPGIAGMRNVDIANLIR
jgi:hypothetical protein